MTNLMVDHMHSYYLTFKKIPGSKPFWHFGNPAFSERPIWLSVPFSQMV